MRSRPCAAGKVGRSPPPGTPTAASKPKAAPADGTRQPRVAADHGPGRPGNARQHRAPGPAAASMPPWGRPRWPRAQRTPALGQERRRSAVVVVTSALPCKPRRSSRPSSSSSSTSRPAATSKRRSPVAWPPARPTARPLTTSRRSSTRRQGWPGRGPRAIALPLVRPGRLAAPALWEIKARMLPTSGLLALPRNGASFADLGGLEALEGVLLAGPRPGRPAGTCRPAGSSPPGPPARADHQFLVRLGMARRAGRQWSWTSAPCSARSWANRKANLRQTLRQVDAMARKRRHDRRGREGLARHRPRGRPATRAWRRGSSPGCSPGSGRS